jgi:hypothetical protein
VRFRLGGYVILAALLVKLAWIGAGGAVTVGLLVFALTSYQRGLGE